MLKLHRQCPVCGGEGEIVNLDGSDIYYVRCKECGFRTYAVHQEQNAVYEWDTMSRRTRNSQ